MAVQAMGVFCEDIREEVGGLHTVVGVFPDNVNVPSFPAALLKFAFYLRVRVDLGADVEPIAILLVSIKGEELPLTTIDANILAKAQEEARASGLPFGTVISKAVTQGVPIEGPGRIKAVARTGEGETICATLNFQAVPPSAA
jgi:hypothetical protein